VPHIIKMILSEIQAYIDEAENNSSLFEEQNFHQRVEVIDFIGFGLIDQVEKLLRTTAFPQELILLRSRAEKLRSELEAVDLILFERLRASIRTEGCTGKTFQDLITEYVGLDPEGSQTPEEPGYDNLDILINGLTFFKTMPEQTIALEPEMVYYQKTPARIVFELVGRAHFGQEDVFFDLGSGLGQVAILVNLLAGITVRGIEFEPAFCDYSRDCAAKLNLSNVTFINVDARQADYSEGTVFFMFTPFGGEMLQEVLEILRKESLLRKITIITYGPCTSRVALQSWLDFAGPGGNNISKPGIFRSL
jgi:hypothetical protein